MIRRVSIARRYFHAGLGYIGIFFVMAAWMPPVELPEEVGARSPADPYCWLVDLAAVLAETENLLKGRSPLARWRAGAFEEIEDALLL